MRLPPKSEINATYSAAVNLAATRVFSVQKGRNVFKYKMSRNRVDAWVQCLIKNLTLSVVFVP